jgi:hypothetical protein
LEDVTVIVRPLPGLIWFLVPANFKNTTMRSSFGDYESFLVLSWTCYHRDRRARNCFSTTPAPYTHPKFVYLPHPDRVHGAIHSISRAEKSSIPI